jgi:anti-anti-sigma factor
MAETRAERPGVVHRPAPANASGQAGTETGGGGTSGVRGVARRFSVEPAAGAPSRLTVTGELDCRTAPTLERALRGATTGDCVVDCAGLTFIDSVGIATLVRHKAGCDADGRAFMLTNLGGTARRAMEVCGLLAMFQCGPG